MPFTPAQRRLFAVQYRRGELSKKEFDKRMSEGVRTDVDRTGHARKAKRSKKRSKKKTARKASRRKKRRMTRR